MGGRITLDSEDDVYRIMDLSVSRAFGDIEYSKYVKPIPDIFTYTVKPTDQFLILACDGLWDVVSNQEAVNYVLTNKDKTKNIAYSLGKWAIDVKGSYDNVSIIIVFFTKKIQQATIPNTSAPKKIRKKTVKKQKTKNN